MASDPYHNFAADLRSSLSSARQLAKEYEERTRHGSKAPAGTTGDDTLLARLQDAIDALESDFGDVRASVDMLEKRGPERFGVDAYELDRRKRFVRECEGALKTLQDTARRQTSVNVRNDHHKGPRLDDASDDDDDDVLAFEMEQQQQMMHKQDNALDLIGNTLSGLQRQASTLGHEIGEQVELIGALDSEVDASQSKLNRAIGKMDELVRRSDDRMGGWCVWLLIIILMILCLVAFII